jgi:hypothetical protein
MRGLSLLNTVKAAQATTYSKIFNEADQKLNVAFGNIEWQAAK